MEKTLLNPNGKGIVSYLASKKQVICVHSHTYACFCVHSSHDIVSEKQLAYSNLSSANAVCSIPVGTKFDNASVKLCGNAGVMAWY